MFENGIGMSLYHGLDHWLLYDLLATAVRPQHIHSAGTGFSIPLDRIQSGEILRCEHLTVPIRSNRAVIELFVAYISVDSVLDACSSSTLIMPFTMTYDSSELDFLKSNVLF